jgi:hypothetical protein
MPKRLMVFDPSGNFYEGKGTSGWCVFEDGELKEFGDIASKIYKHQEEYWIEHTKLISEKFPDLVLCESYRLYGGARGKAQIGSSLETPQLIGHIRMFCWTSGIRFKMQSPSDKVRVADPQLVKLGILEKRGRSYYCMGKLTNLHIRDSVRHGYFYLKYGKEKDS